MLRDSGVSWVTSLICFVISTELTKLDGAKLFTQFVLDCTMSSVQSLYDYRLFDIKLWSSEFIHKLHQN